MKRLRWLDRLFTLSLYLYPKEFRRQFGEEMREVFQQQCTHQRIRIRLVGELLLDNLRAASAEHGRAFAQQGIARMHVLMALLCLALTGVAMRAQISGAVNDALDATGEAVKQLQYRRAEQAWQQTGTKLAQRTRDLLASGSEKQQLMAALLFAQEQRSRSRSTREANDFWMLSGEVPIGQIRTAASRAARSADPLQLQIATIMCMHLIDCAVDPIVDRLTRLDSGNAASWMIAADTFAKTDSEKARHALEQALRADHYQSFHREVLATWLESVWLQRSDEVWLWPETNHGINAIIFASLQSSATQIMRSCSGKPIDADLCQRLARRWQSSADDYHTALYMQRNAQGYAEWKHKTSLDDLYGMFLDTIEANSEAPQLQPKAIATRIREVGSLAMMQETVRQYSDVIPNH